MRNNLHYSSIRTPNHSADVWAFRAFSAASRATQVLVVVLLQNEMKVSRIELNICCDQ